MPRRDLFMRKDVLDVMEKVHNKATNASKSSGRCGRARCQNCHDLPVFKSKAKTKGRNKKACLIDDKWIVRVRSRSKKIVNTASLPLSDDDDDDAPGVWHADALWCHTDDIGTLYDADFIKMQQAILADLSCTDVVSHGQFAQSFPESDDVDVDHDWDHKMFVDMAEDVIGDNSNDDTYNDDNGNHDAYKDEDCASLADMAWGDLHATADETLSDIESEQSSVSHDWYHVAPMEIVDDDWYLC
ncbi:hypothetical protein GOP47_0005872 [Adiantum capillus-veneris]|uniref:Uncharacterized protein n=1 Tax=Adiantum capillus-veneris TaxID=13818 RepID=A0A9D4V2H6_ADICA|nr:hypothetical protein GOP47_0005872 [Adiantum capillus-veneris]